MNILTLSVNIVDYILSRIIIRNNIDLLVMLARYTRLDKILEYKIEEYFQIDLKNISIVDKSSKKIIFTIK